MAAKIFGRRVDHDRGAVLERPQEVRRCRIVDDERNAERAADCRHFGNRENGQLRVRKQFSVIGARPVVGRAQEVLRVDRIDEANFDSLVLERVGEQIPRAAIKIGRADDVVARSRQILQRKRRRRLTRGQRQPGRPALEGGGTLLEHVVGRVHDARIDVAQLLQREQIARVLGVAELVGRRLIDRHRDRAGGRVGTPAGMQKHGFKAMRI